MLEQNNNRWGRERLLTAIATFAFVPFLAQAANFENLTLNPGFRNASVSGYTGGSFSLPSIANSDRNNNFCLGYGDTTPDHIMELQSDFSRLRIQVNSQGNDTTLVIQGPNNLTLCADDTGASKDASVEEANLRSGKYNIWVGSKNSGDRFRYTLSVQEP